MKWTGCVVSMWEVRNAYKKFVAKPEAKGNLGEVSTGRSITLKWILKENVKCAIRKNL
jgi:hypothetical protein